MTGFWSTTWADVATLLGLLLAYAGYLRAARAAEAARAAAESAHSRVLAIDAVVCLGQGLDRMRALIDLHRRARWELALAHNQEARTMLGQVVDGGAKLDAAECGTLTHALRELRSLQEEVERALQPTPAEPDVAVLNSRLARHVDRVQAILTALKVRCGRER